LAPDRVAGEALTRGLPSPPPIVRTRWGRVKNFDLPPASNTGKAGIKIAFPDAGWMLSYKADKASFFELVRHVGQLFEQLATNPRQILDRHRRHRRHRRFYPVIVVVEGSGSLYEGRERIAQ
jgi:hypothetical protein